ncbi:hypothetical protein SAMN05421594_4184 [Chryseobacterium oleae]|uniref:RNA helicase n=1 Tax=Chryseobacterium oleae TaxID=491207 RepID=A0A1I5BTW6_CHROL|nr:hypothetical protein [Chryseobacterium oleae]SFN78219.1 hypothetical protein SAMN05421594_4184 [Chryseobacterium oleae]
MKNDNQKKEIVTTPVSEGSKPERRPTCGIVMPISEIDGCTPGHWEEVLSIITEVAEAAGFETKLVSEAEDIGIIHKRIIQNVYGSDIIICDVSAKNPNVMFELGLRLAFDKATVIIKDDQTSYSFDTSPIEHLIYPRDLRFHKILTFKMLLEKKLLATFEKSKDEKHSMYLKDFGQITVAKLDSKEVSKEDFILEKINELQSDIKLIRNEPQITTSDKITYRNSSPGTQSLKEFMVESYKEYCKLYNVEEITSVLSFKNFINKKASSTGFSRVPSDQFINSFIQSRT